LIGLEPTNSRGHPFDGIIPVTPVMDTQLDHIFIRDLLIPLTKRLLKTLKEKIDEQKKENWFEIYLAMFIMMSNMGWVMKDVVYWTSRHGLKVEFRLNQLLSVPSSLTLLVSPVCSILYANV
jgi:hypothetical protein